MQGSTTGLADRFATVLLLVLATYAAWSLLDYSGWTASLIVAIACVTGVAGLTSGGVSRRLVVAAVAAGGIAVVLASVSAVTDSEVWLSLGSLIGILLLAGSIVAILRRIALATRVGFELILGAISVYVLLGIMFTFSYAAIHRFQDAPFFEGVGHPEASDFLFFSFTTLTTTGYGNLVPGGQPGEMVAGLEMLVGQIFLITLIARLVALWRPGERLRAARAEHSPER